jgi:hypothetical protein
MVEFEEIAAFGRMFGTAGALVLELRRLAGLRSTRNREGWGSIDQGRFEAIGLSDKFWRSHVVAKLRDLGVIETRGSPGSKLEYRLNPNCAKPRAEVVDLATRRRVGKVAQ